MDDEKWEGGEGEALSRVLYGNSVFRKKNPKYNAGFKNMPKLMRLGMGGNGLYCERRLLNLKNFQRLSFSISF